MAILGHKAATVGTMLSMLSTTHTDKQILHMLSQEQIQKILRIVRKAPIEKRTGADISCPVCGYYCLGKGGIGCVDKPSLVELHN